MVKSMTKERFKQLYRISHAVKKIQGQGNSTASIDACQIISTGGRTQFRLSIQWSVVSGQCQSFNMTALSRCRGLVLSRCRAVALSRCRAVALSRCRAVALSRCRAVALSRCRGVAVSRCRGVAVSRYGNLLRKTSCDQLSTLSFFYAVSALASCLISYHL